ncbi:NACHT domain-containing protein [Dongia deserti]|uniref:NACHT domain-containing protein n=1 Tax=Dongia deserti TaxID=2268030 RepID=UPI000E65791C|nr:NACHT domain-containing protein [Dongia deserti]
MITASALAQSIGSRLAWAGLARVFDEGRFALLIRGAYKGTTRATVVDRLAKELERAIGNSGDLTEPVGAFLEALSQSGLMASMCEAAALYPLEVSGSVHVHEGQLAAFIALYKQYVKDDEAAARNWYERIARALATVLYRSNRKELSQFVDEASQREMMARLNEIDRRLQDLFVGQKGKPAELADATRIGSAEIEAEVREVANRLHTRYAEVPVYGPDMRQRWADIEEIFIPCKLRRQRATEWLSGSFKLGSNWASFPKLPTHMRISDFTWGTGTTAILSGVFSENFAVHDTLLAPEDLETHVNRAVVLGNPGGGKSTLVQYVAFRLCKLARDGKGRLPIVVTIRDYEKALDRRSSLTLEEFIVECLGTAVTRPVSSAVVRNLLGFGRAVLIFDGLDEIMNLGRRNRFVDDVRVLCDAYPLCPAIVTSRVVGYERAPLPKSFAVYELQELTLEQSQQYFRKLTSVINDVPQSNLDKESADFTSKTARASDLVSNPLMLALMTWLYHERRGEMPATRARLYRACAELLFEQWDKRRNIDYPGLPESFEVSRLLPALAWEIFRNENLSASVEREWLRSSIEAFLRKEYDKDRENRARKDAGAIIEFITGRAWVLTDAGPGLYRFTHRTFLEYFFSRSLNDRAELVSELFELVKAGVYDGTWIVPAGLALDERVASRTPAAEQVASSICQLIDEAPQEAKGTAVSFGVDALEYLSGASEAGVRAIVSAILRAVPTGPTAEALLRSSNKRRTVLLDTLASFIAGKLGNREGEVTGHFADWLEFLPGSTEIREAVQKKLRALPSTYADEDVTLAKIRLDLLGSHYQEAARNGVGLWDSAIRIYGRVNAVAVDVCKCLEQLRAVAAGTDVETLPYAKFAVALSKAVEAESGMAFLPPAPLADRKLPEGFSLTDLIEESSEEIGFAALVCAAILRDVAEVYPEGHSFGVDLAASLANARSQMFLSRLGGPTRRIVKARTKSDK